MSGPDFETLLRSPLDDEPESQGWGFAVLGLVAGGAGVIGLSLILGLWATPDETPVTTVADTAASAADLSREFRDSVPSGFSDIGNSIAMKPTARVAGDAGVVVSFATATTRDADPETTPVPLGGRWQLENTAGAVTSATRLVYDRLHTGVIGVEFAEDLSDGEILRMTERWDTDERTGSTDIPFTGTPFTTVDAVTIDLGDGIALRLIQIELGRHLGQIVWALSGTGEPTGIANFAIAMIDEQGATVGDYLSMPSSRDPTRSSGVIDLFWDRGFNAHPDEGRVVEITATVRLPAPEPVDVVFDLDNVPHG